MSSPVEFGDFQTPPLLVDAIIAHLERAGGTWIRALEPTCGTGNFIAGLLRSQLNLEEIIGLELQQTYVERAARLAQGETRCRVTIEQADAFETNFLTGLGWQTRGPVLVVGNPPWVTTATLARTNGDNRPARQNIHGLKGIEAVTGESNFDLAEAVWLRLLQNLQQVPATIALLCKRSVAHRVLSHVFRERLPVTSANIRAVDSKKWWDVSVDACLLCLNLNEKRQPASEVPVYERLDSSQPLSVLGWINGRLVTNPSQFSSLAFLDGSCPFEWRQGVKHDLASVMELQQQTDERLVNKLGETVDIEYDVLYPLLKSSDLHHGRHARPTRWVPMTQRTLGEDTTKLQQHAPAFWEYLSRHAKRFAARKSSIYRNRPPFSLFGVGPYTFSMFKVAVSGMHPNPVFRLVPPWQQRPVLFDDTCYFLPCDSPQLAAVLVVLLNDERVLAFIKAQTMQKGKRPVTKKVLKRIDLDALFERFDRTELKKKAVAALEQLSGSLRGELSTGWEPEETWRLSKV